jgi:hypothetical protein
MKISIWALVIIVPLSLVPALGSGCSAEHAGEDSGSLSSEGTASGLDAFQNGLYGFFRTANCTQCHASGGEAPAQYWFAQSDVSTAYSIALTLVNDNFSNPTGAPWPTYAQNNHCANPICTIAANQAVVQGMVNTWFSAEIAASGSTGAPQAIAKYLTSTMPIPATLPMVVSKAAPAVIRFPLAKVDPSLASIAGAILEIDIQLISSTEYRITAAKIAGNTAPVTITGIHVYLKTSTAGGVGTEDPNQGEAWDAISATAAVFALPTTLPATPLGAVPLVTTEEDLQVQSSSDVITIGFDNLQ